MLIVRVRGPHERISRAIYLARGYVMGFRRGPDGKPVGVDVVLRDPALADELRSSGTELEVLFDSRTGRDPRENVSKGNRYAEELERLKKARVKPEA